jgi:UDP-N-acetylglucosamine transferase subunit ALG13
MIFVTVGSAEPFDRLVDAVATLGGQSEVVVQHGASPPPPGAARSVPFMSFDECLAHIREAQVVVTHAGVGTVLNVLSQGKRPIVVPRLRVFGEAVDDHQLHFARRLGAAGLVVDVEDLRLLGRVVDEAAGARVSSSVESNGLVSELREYIGAVVRDRNGCVRVG